MRLRLVDHYHRHVSTQEIDRPFRVRIFRQEEEEGLVMVRTLFTLLADKDGPAVFDVEPPMVGPFHVNGLQGRVLGTGDVLYTALGNPEMFTAPGTYTVTRATFLHEETEESTP